MKHLLTALTLAAMASAAQAGNLQPAPAGDPAVVAGEGLGGVGGLSAGTAAAIAAGVLALALIANDDDEAGTTTTTSTPE